MGEYTKEEIQQLSFISEISINSILLLLLILRFISISKTGVFSRTQLKWTNLFFMKLLLSVLLSLNYGAMSISINPLLNCKLMLKNLLNSVVWLFASALLYYEYLRQLNQSWLSLRLLYLIHFLIYISKITLLIIYRDIKPINLLSSIVFGVLSLPMSIFSIGFANDALNDKEKEYIPTIDEITSNFLQSDGTNSNSISNNSKDLIELSITENKSYTFYQEGELLISSRMQNNTDSNNIKLKFTLKILIPNNEEKYQHSKKKTIKSIIEFNQRSLLVLEKDTSDLRAFYLVDHNEIVQAIQLISRSLIQRDSINSLINLKEKFALLELNYTRLCKYKQFLIDFLAFLSFDNKEIITNIINVYNLLLESHHSNELGRISMRSIRDNVNNNELLYREEQGINSNIDNVISKLTLQEMVFINEVISKTNHIVLVIDTNCSVNEAIAFKINTETVAYSIQVPIQKLLNYFKSFASKAKARTKGKTVHMLLSNEDCLSQMMNSNLKEDLRLNLEGLLSNILNDLFYFNESLLELFQLKKIIKSNIKASMLQCAPKVFFDDTAIELFEFDSQVLDLRKYDIECEIEQVMTVGTNIQCEALVIVFNLNARHKNSKCSWKTEVDLSELYVAIGEIAEMAISYPKLLTPLSVLLNQLKQLLITYGISITTDSKMKNLFNNKNKGKGKGKANQCTSMPTPIDQNQNIQKMCYYLSTSINSLFLLDKREVFYSVNFRQLFCIDQIRISTQNVPDDNESMNCSMNSLM